MVEQRLLRELHKVDLTDGGETTLHTHAGGAAVNIKQTEVDFGDLSYVAEKIFTITDTDVLVTSQLIATLAYEAPTNKDLDEIEMDEFEINCKPAAGSFDMLMKSRHGSVYGKFKVNYLIG